MNDTSVITPAGQRTLRLLDGGSFVEIGRDVTARTTDFNMRDRKAPSDGVITGYGTIDGNLVFVYSQDGDVLHGTVGEMHAKKIARVYEMALKTGAPVIGLIDCAGMRLEESTDALAAFGDIWRLMAKASGVIVQITGIFGMCAGGMAVLAGMSDFVFMDEKNGRLFVNSPDAVEGAYISKADISSAKFQSVSGAIDLAASEEGILDAIRELICMLPLNCKDKAGVSPSDDSLNRMCDGIKETSDAAERVLMISDGASSFFETGRGYAPDILTGFVRVGGRTAGVVANRRIFKDGAKASKEGSLLSDEGARKASRFVTFCDAFNIPVLTLTDVYGFDLGLSGQAKLSRACAGLAYAFASATVPKINVVTGDAYGSAGVIMNSRPLGADMIFAWDDAKIGMMDAASAAGIIYPGASADELKGKTREIEDMQNSPLFAAKRGYIDDVIRPEETRQRVIGALEMLATKREHRVHKKHGTV